MPSLPRPIRTILSKRSLMLPGITGLVVTQWRSIRKVGPLVTPTRPWRHPTTMTSAILMVMATTTTSVGDRPEAAYAKFDTAGNINWRWYVERRLNDTDGDGFTDSFWWIPPLPIKDGVHHVVGVSVVDLSGKLNLNTATIFRRNEDSRYQNDAGFVLPQATAGHTPADVALVGQEVPPLIHNGLAADFHSKVVEIFRRKRLLLQRVVLTGIQVSLTPP